MQAPVPLTLLAVLVSAPGMAAEPGDLSLGVGVALSVDLPDPVSKGDARFAPGPSLLIPFRWTLVPLARARLGLRADLGTGTDTVRWTEEVDGEPVELQSSGHFAMFVGVTLTAGVDFLLPTPGKVAPYLGADLGLAWVGTYHSFDGATQVLLDPAQNDLDDPGNVDPFTTQWTALTDLHGGVDVPLSEGVALWVETGYSVAFLNSRDLRKTPPELDATRDAFGWNAFRIGAGVSFLF